MSIKPVARKGTLAIAVIGDEPTVTGFLLAGIGERHSKYGTNFLIVDKGKVKFELTWLRYDQDPN